jgi:hypothetical protein
VSIQTFIADKAFHKISGHPPGKFEARNFDVLLHVKAREGWISTKVASGGMGVRRRE